VEDEKRQLMNLLPKIMHRYHFYLPEKQSPTYFNLAKYLEQQGWFSTRYKWLANFSEQNFKFDVIAAECLEFKNFLAQLVQEYCPEVSPPTYCINDRNWSSVLSDIADKYYRKDNILLDQVDNLVWILKPAHLNNGRHIKIFQEISQIERHYISSNRLGGEHVLQQYIVHPHLLRGHKYSIRMFVVITNYAGAHIYPHGYFNVAQHPYQPHAFQDLRSHLTNEHLSKDEVNVIQIPSAGFDIFPPLYQQIKMIVSSILNGLKKSYPHAFVCQKNRALAIFGFDFIVDDEMRVWLLEANHGPCFPIEDEHPLQKYLYYDFWQAFIASFVFPIAKRQSLQKIQHQSFEPI